jgi:hypothetical protein
MKTATIRRMRAAFAGPDTGDMKLAYAEAEVLVKFRDLLAMGAKNKKGRFWGKPATRIGCRTYHSRLGGEL